MLTFLLRASGVVILLISLVHLALGVRADLLLGAQVPLVTASDPVLDSQNRFYGTAFSLYGVLLLIGATDLKRHALMLRCCLWCFFASGVARIVSIVLIGVPTPLVMALLALELVAPPILALLLERDTQGV